VPAALALRAATGDAAYLAQADAVIAVLDRHTGTGAEGHVLAATDTPGDHPPKAASDSACRSRREMWLIRTGVRRVRARTSFWQLTGSRRTTSRPRRGDSRNFSGELTANNFFPWDAD